MTPKELIDKITLAAEQLESLRTEYDLPISVSFEEGEIALQTSNKKHMLEVFVNDISTTYGKTVGGRTLFYDTYEELVESIKTDEI